MTTITIKFDNEVNRAFRERTGEQEQIAERQLDLVKKGIYNLKGWKFKREEIYIQFLICCNKLEKRLTYISPVLLNLNIF